jgi:hypothetical protein
MNVRFYVLWMWKILDPIYYLFTRLNYVGTDPIRNIFRVRLLTYTGHPITLADGSCLKLGDTLVKIHLHNVRLLHALLPLHSDIERGKYIYRSVQASLPGLAEYIKNHPRKEEIKGILGITLLNKGCAHLGFETHPILNNGYKVMKWFPQLLMCLLFVSQPIKTFRKQSIKYILMTKETLFERYSRT